MLKRGYQTWSAFPTSTKIVITLLSIVAITALSLFVMVFSTYSFIYQIVNDPQSKIFTPQNLQLFRDLLYEGLELMETRVSLFDIQSKQRFKLKIDVSGAGEFTYLYNLFLKKGMPKSKLIVDIGAYDCLIGSNSFDFLQLGDWDAMAVEPIPKHQELCKKYIKKFQARGQRVEVAPVAIGEKSGESQFYIGESFDNQMGSLMKDVYGPDTSIVDSVTVTVLTVDDFAKQYNVPKSFGILSIDAEGLTASILEMWLNAGYRPEYIIFEEIWSDVTSTYKNTLENLGYVDLTHIGFNIIYELQT